MYILRWEGAHRFFNRIRERLPINIPGVPPANLWGSDATGAWQRGCRRCYRGIDWNNQTCIFARRHPPPSVNVFQEGGVESCLHGYLTNGINTINGIRMSIIWMRFNSTCRCFLRSRIYHINRLMVPRWPHLLQASLLIFQISLDSGRLPNDWLTANVSPIYKGASV